jgi:hypothetical protein
VSLMLLEAKDSPSSTLQHGLLVKASAAMNGLLSHTESKRSTFKIFSILYFLIFRVL